MHLLAFSTFFFSADSVLHGDGEEKGMYDELSSAFRLSRTAFRSLDNGLFSGMGRENEKSTRMGTPELLNYFEGTIDVSTPSFS